MPLYDYDCAACARRFEVMHGVHADSPAICPLCGGGPVKKAIAAPTIHYKGSGWAKKERRATVKSGSTSKGDDEGSSGDGAGSEQAAKTAVSTDGASDSGPSSSGSSDSGASASVGSSDPVTKAKPSGKAQPTAAD